MQVPVKIYLEEFTERHQYVFELVFVELLGVNYKVVSDINHCHLNYSSNPSKSIDCAPYGLLEENSILSHHKEKANFEQWKTSWCFYRTSDTELPFDLFSASFFLVSRYEEYLDFQVDTHHRFPATESILVHQHKIEEPLVNQWALILKTVLEQRFSELEFRTSKFKYLSTLDIDQAWKFKNKGIVRHLLGTLRDLKEKKWENFMARWPVLLGLRKDPFYQFDWIRNLEVKHRIETLYFFLLGDYGEFDKNISHRNKNFIRLMRDIAKTNKIGIHPSYASNHKVNKVSLELARLEKIANQKIIIARQHFLMHRMPDTYRLLIQTGIREDHTMGYSTHLGFRAGIASPFRWFDLEKNESTPLTLFPFCAMDITPLHYEKLTPEEANARLSKLMLKVNAVGGLFISLWHNESLSNTERWKGWKDVYSNMLKQAEMLEH